MRQIDNMTPQEIDTLHLKGMLSDQRTIPAEKPTALPLHLEQANGQTTIYDAKLNVLFRVDGRHFDALNPIVASVNHAAQLAEALREAITEYGVLTDNMPEYKRKDWDKALAAYEESRQ